MIKETRNDELRRKLRFAVMCTGETLPAAFAKSIEELLAIEGVEVALLIVDANPPTRSTAWEKARMFFSFHGLWALHARLFPAQRLASYRPVDLIKTFDLVPKLRCGTVRKGKFSEYFLPEDIEKIKEYNLDFILRFAFGIVRGDILNVARYGVWSFHHGDETKFRGGPPAFWEIYYDEPVTAAILQRVTDRLDGGIVLEKCYIKTRKCSYGENLDAIMWATSYMPSRVCRDILNNRADRLGAPPSRTDAPVLRAPNDLKMLRFLYKTVSSWLKQQFVSIFFSEDWNVGIVREPIHSFLDPAFRPNVEWLTYKKANCYIADPFLHKNGSKLKLMVEEFDWQTNRGSIVETELPENKRPPNFMTAIDEGVHMSYPYVFEAEGRWYCVPEAFEKKDVSLYTFDDEQEVWLHAGVIIQGFAAVDSTIFQYDGQWWLLCTNHDDEVESKLFLWHAPALLGPWKQHYSNPVKVDVRSSRPAGRPFFFEDQLYRPAQDCSITYGGAISINRVTSLSTSEFIEEPAARVGPIRNSPYCRGIHTAVSLDGITVIDGNRLVFAPTFAWRRFREKLKKLAFTQGPGSTNH